MSSTVLLLLVFSAVTCATDDVEDDFSTTPFSNTPIPFVVEEINSTFEDASTTSTNSFDLEDGFSTVPKNASKDDRDYAELYDVISRDDVTTFEKLLQDKFDNDVNAANSSKTTILHVAATYGSKKVLERLLQDPELDLNPKDLNRVTPFHLACLNGLEDLVKSIVKLARDKEIIEDVIEAEDGLKRWTPLFYIAMSTSNPDKVREVVNQVVGAQGPKKPPNYYHRDIDDMQPTHVATIKRQFTLLAELLTSNSTLAQEPCCGVMGKTISHLAAEYGVVDFLDSFDGYFDANAVDGKGQNAACWAAINGQVDFGRKLSEENHVDINNGRCCYGNAIGTPLQVAAYHRRIAYVELLLTKSPSQLVNVNGSGSPIHAMALTPSNDSALDKRLIEMLRAPLNNVINSRDVDGRTPFLVAIKSGNMDFAKLLRKQGAEIIGIVDKYGYSPLHMAQDTETVKFLKEIPGRDYDDINLRTHLGNLTVLHVAVLEHKSVDFLQFLLEEPSNKLAVNSIGQSIAHLAVASNNLDAIRLFLGDNLTLPTFSIRDNKGRTAIFLAVEMDRVDVVKEIMSLNASMASTFNFRDQTPLHLAISIEKFRVANEIVKAIVGFEELLSTICVKQDGLGQTILHLLPMGCRPEAFELSKGLSKCFETVQHLRDRNGDSVLEVAVRQKCGKMAVAFLLGNMNCKLHNRHGYTPLHLVKRLRFHKVADEMVATGKCSIDQTDVCNISVSEMADKDRCGTLPIIAKGRILGYDSNLVTKCNGTQVGFACHDGYRLRGNGQIECNAEGKWLVQGNCLPKDCFLPEKQAEKDLLIAGYEGNLQRIRFLLASEQVGVNTVTYNAAAHGAIGGETLYWNGATVLMFATAKCRSKVVEFLVNQAGADVNQKNDQGKTPLMYAAECGLRPMVQFLVNKAKANPFERSNDLNTVLMYASWNGHVDVVDFLLKDVGVNANEKNKLGETALMWAAEQGKLEVVKYLVEKAKVKVNDVANNGWTALMFAADKCHIQTVYAYLLKEAPRADAKMVKKAADFADECSNRDYD